VGADAGAEANRRSTKSRVNGRLSVVCTNSIVCAHAHGARPTMYEHDEELLARDFVLISSSSFVPAVAASAIGPRQCPRAYPSFVAPHDDQIVAFPLCGT
jgi:hypothetical protein